MFVQLKDELYEYFLSCFFFIFYYILQAAAQKLIVVTFTHVNERLTYLKIVDDLPTGIILMIIK